jgi:hypothetical protein
MFYGTAFAKLEVRTLTWNLGLVRSVFPQAIAIRVVDGGGHILHSLTRAAREAGTFCRPGLPMGPGKKGTEIWVRPGSNSRRT